MERTTVRLHRGYRFWYYPEGKAEPEVYKIEYDDSAWESVTVPHDWAISGEFKEENDLSYMEVVNDGIMEPIKHSGRTGALPTVGMGIYRLWIDIPKDAEGREVFLEMDGVMWESNIYINEKHVYNNHFGYKSYCVNITDAVEYGTKNLLVVEASVYTDCSRWYPGAGIYRNAYLVIKDQEHIRYNGVWFRQVEANAHHATFLLEVDYEGPVSVSMQADIYDPEGHKVAEVQHGTYEGELSDMFRIPDVKLWSIEAPYLYTAEVRLLNADEDVVDNTTVRFGARKIEFDAERGFFLNNKPVKIQGVCNHHDMGSLGAAVNVAALRRQLRIMREMGVNSIRMSHNPPSPELLDLCDEMGFLVMDEFFDEWYTAKISNGYAQYYKKHAETDAKDIIRRDRNHPSVIFWSLGNEMLEQWNPEGWRATKWLSDICHSMDPTRPTTAGLSASWPAFENYLAHWVDVVGINYKPHQYEEYKKVHPDMKFVGTETASCISTRGVYHLPAEVAIPPVKHEDLSISAYELEAPEWAYYAEREFVAQDDLEYVCGEYVWTGLDYLGEPTPYYHEWPSRSSYFGIVDLAGLPKNRFYAYKARWTNEKVLHIFPHWNWEGHEGTVVPVHVFASPWYHEVELFVNGRSYGRRTWQMDTEIERYRLIWDTVIYEPGEVKAVAYDKDGKVLDEAVVRTAGEPQSILLQADQTEIAADGEDLVYVTAMIVDEEGNLCPKASHRLYYAVEGVGELLTTDNGSPAETEAFVRPDKKALAGYCVACIRSLESQTGTLKVHCTGDGLTGASITVNVK